MPYGIYLSAAGAQVQDQRLQVLSHNLANIDTPGFRRELAIIEARHSAAIRQGEEPPGTGSLNDVGGGVSVEQTVTDHSRGVLQHTQNELDFAIDGDGFFLVENAAGDPFLTRAGNFHFSPDGYLLNEQGYYVLTQEGGRAAVDPNRPWKFLEHGLLSQGETGALLAVVQPRELSDLARVGQNLFRPLAPFQHVAPEQRRVVNEYVELSGVKPTTAMTELIEASRAYEANVRMIQNHDQVLGGLVNRILRQA